MQASAQSKSSLIVRCFAWLTSDPRHYQIATLTGLLVYGLFWLDFEITLIRAAMILGASLLGIECDEVIHSILDAMYAKAPYTTIQRAVHIHPTVSELVPTMLGELKPLE